jgi:hypothetical protein
LFESDLIAKIIGPASRTPTVSGCYQQGPPLSLAKVFFAEQILVKALDVWPGTIGGGGVHKRLSDLTKNHIFTKLKEFFVVEI